MLRRFRKKLAYRFGLPGKIQPAKHIPIVVSRESGWAETSEAPQYRLTICAIIRDEAAYLREWLLFHYQRGADHFIIYDNQSRDNPKAVLEPWISRGTVELMAWPSFLAGANAQHLCYAHACSHMTGKTRWLSFLDLDEFLFPVDGASLPEILADYEDLSGIAVFLRCFGPNGHKVRPDGFIIENYITRLSDKEWENRQYKSIVKPEKVHAVISAQRCEFIDQKYPAYDEGRRPLYDSTEHSHVSERLRINHYVTRSMAEFEQKVSRRYFWSSKNNEKRRAQKLAQHQHLFDCQIEDRDILRFLAELSAGLAAEGWSDDTAREPVEHEASGPSAASQGERLIRVRD